MATLSVPPAAAWAALVCLLAAGCTQPSVTPASADASPAALFDESTGAIAGTVTDDLLLPLGDVKIQLDGDAVAATDANGSFLFPYVSPGAHRLSFAKEGYLPVLKDVDAQAGAPTPVSVTLSRTASDSAAYYETLVQGGMDGCSVGYRFEDKPSQGINPASLNYSYPACIIVENFPVDVAPTTSILSYDVGSLDATTGLITETQFQAAELLSKEMFVMVTFLVAGGQHNTIDSRIDESPVWLRVPSNMTTDAIARQPAGSETCKPDACVLWTWHSVGYFTLGAEPYGVGVGFQQRFEEYVTIFHNSELPAAFSALPDA